MITTLTFVAVLVGSLQAVPRPIGGLFTVVQFPNDECATEDTSSPVGTCVTASECSSRGGTASGKCAASFGVCCLVTDATCSSSANSISHNNTYFRNPSFPSAYPTSTSTTSCLFQITKTSEDICQLRLDFQTLELGQTDSDGSCTDSLAVTLSAESSVTTTNPSLCGTVSGQHLYLDLGKTVTSTATITISLAASSASAKWNVLARQIACDPTFMAPTDCAQYLTGVSGSYSTLGYNSGVTTVENLMSLDYKICIRREAGYCSIRHSTCSATSFDLSAGNNVDTAPGTRGATNCYQDFIGIPAGSLDGTGVTYDRYCGGALVYTDAITVPQAIISKSIPFEVHVHTDGTETASATPYGACLNYQQLPC